MPTLKSLIKSVIPKYVLALRQRRLDRKMMGVMQEYTDPKGTFARIYESGYWGKSGERGENYYSGSGSHVRDIVEPYVAAVKIFLTSLDEKPDAVDLGCGDFAVGSQIRPYCGKYIAADVVDGLIARNKQRFSGDDVEFRVVDMVQDELPQGQVAFLRQVLQHLSNSDVQKVVTKLSAKYHYVVLTEHLPASGNFVPNLDKPRGPTIRLNLEDKSSGVVLTRPPFNLAVKQDTVLCEVPQDMAGIKGIIRTNLYKLR